ncbi:zinc finger CCCH domain-containing protein 14 [Galleria mellonella]|uniref:Zinc finger CCCH domain-containing protein 14 n=1 Tax=Galleria mellonella TaxID=7137 RepID=A0ABM3MDV9_GALME|nr:zinc finger CCCH domain-containing protein 14 [Galleria mellonella]
MNDVGSEIGQKMRSAIKAKLTELGCYVDDELPDYVMVMVANKRTRAQMEDDLQLFLGDNTDLFVNWLHQVLKKLQEVTVTAPIKSTEKEKSKEKSSSKEHKSKDKKDKGKKSDSIKKSKKKGKEKVHRKKEEKKSKKKSKHHEMIRPNIPPLLMNMEKESEPSITDVFAGQILKNHGISLESLKEESTQVDKKPTIQELKRPILPIIDPATISSQVAPDSSLETNESQEVPNRASVSSVETPRDEQIKEINEIEAKILGLKQKLAEQLDSMSDDEDFLNIRTEAEELMNDFAEDVFQEISQQAPVNTPPLNTRKSPSPPPPTPKPSETPVNPPKEPTDVLPQIELKLPKRPVRERLGVREEPKTIPEVKEKDVQRQTDSSERFTPEREPEFRPPSKSAKSRLGELPEPQKRSSASENTSDKTESSSKRLTSKVSVLENKPRSGCTSCASVGRVRPRPRGPAPAPALLLRAVADAHKSLLNIPLKVDPEPSVVKRALVLPMRRCVDAQKIVIQVPGSNARVDNSDNISLGGVDSDDDKATSDVDKDEYVPTKITKKIINNDYLSSRTDQTRKSSGAKEELIIDSINIHNPTVGKDKSTQFIVTMDGYHPNAFLAKKLMTEGILSEVGDKINKTKDALSVLKTQVTEQPKEKSKEPEKVEERPVVKKRLSEMGCEVESKQIAIKTEDQKLTTKRKSTEMPTPLKEDTPAIKKRRASPIVFDVKKKEKEPERVRERTDSPNSENHVTLTTASAHKYDSVPPLSQAERKPVWCRLFPLCRYGAACAFQHPRCKFAAACTRRGCLYSHPHTAPLQPLHAAASPVVASHVVPAANYKSISPGVVPSVCKYYPNCTNPACHFYHPKPCRYGKACNNKLECNFYHSDLPIGKWRYPA